MKPYVKRAFKDNKGCQPRRPLIGSQRKEMLWPKLDGLFDVRTLAFDLKTDIRDSYFIVKRTCKYHLLVNYSNTDKLGEILIKFFS